MDDVIGGAPDPRPPPPSQRSWRLPAAAGLLRRRRRLVATVAVVAVVAAVVAVSRAGLPDPSPTGPGAASATPPVPVTGELLQLASGQQNLYALVQDCPGPPDPCRLRLVVSGTDGRAWRSVPLPDARASIAAARAWRLEVSGSEDLLSIEDEPAGVVHLGRSDGTFVIRRIAAGPDLHRVPANRESLTRLCDRPRCATLTVEFLEPRTGMRGRLAIQPPFPPAVLAVEGGQLWVAGIDPRTRQYTVAVSTDDGGSWHAVALPGVPPGDGAVARLVPVPERDLTYLLLGRPTAEGVEAVSAVWTVPDPRRGGAPQQVRPQSELSVQSAVGLRDGRLALVGDAPAVLSPDGAVTRSEAAVPVRRILRGPHSLLVAEADPPDGLGIAVSDTGNPDDWQVRRIRLPR